VNGLRNVLRRLPPMRGRHVAVAVLISLVLGAAAGLVLWNSARTPAPGTTVVSLTFDGSTADQRQAVQILDRHGLQGTFFTNSGNVDTPGYLTRSDLQKMEEDGHEIGGHTVLNTDLARIDPAEARREVCIDRKTLQGWGLHPVAFAYPYGSRQEPALASVVRDCGYSSARDFGNLQSASAESLPPADPYQIRTAAGGDPTWTLEDLKAQVVNAQRAGGGWVPLVFHRVCDGCSSNYVRPDVLDAFTEWLTASEPTGIQVRTMSAVVKGNNRGAPTVPFGIPSESPPNPAFAVGPDLRPTCWTVMHNGQNDADVTVALGDGGRSVLTMTVDNFVNGDAKVLPAMDLGACSLYAQPGVTYTVGALYRSDATPQFVLYTRGPDGGWSYWTSGPLMDPSADWRAAQWSTPPTPPGTTGLSWGLGLTSGGSVSVAQFGMVSNSPPLPAAALAPSDDGYSSIGLWGIAACVLTLLGVWWLIGGPVSRAVARRRAATPPPEQSAAQPWKTARERGVVRGLGPGLPERLEPVRLGGQDVRRQLGAACRRAGEDPPAQALTGEQLVDDHEARPPQAGLVPERGLGDAQVAGGERE
jgi:peptidoglycan/xylan/chitin deacetylase (PgdA/CDA1 family)